MPTAIPNLPPVLIIEDNEIHLSLTLEAFEEAGVTNPVHTAASLQAARARLQAYQEQGLTLNTGLPCVVLLDLRLPDGSGMEILREIERDEKLNPIPVVILTSSRTPRTSSEPTCSGRTAISSNPWCSTNSTARYARRDSTGPC